ncbi:uncharacterized protein N7515_009390 [Penicillium bovifimosum]|uniref:Uncharacterized protein n=1 Tax=Penicillium bovifimosum TaxID=126998 RepID=A0A9W9GJF4_9EURO|nr:uncharacterized protein N7515_009390 [Penicillium bovifimosum]KAJ5121429.1 hypothetical protein N7515_009390 [Penicillium bovifimosum]
MKTILFYLVAFFALRISAFGLSGAYERMWYWSAYQMEQQYGDAANRQIATSCKSCSFAQFVTWIAKSKDQAMIESKFAAYKKQNGKDYVPSSVDEGAKWLDDNGITKDMALSRVVEKVYDVPNVFKKVSKAIGDIYKSKQPDPSHPPFSDAFLARKRVDMIRTAESHLTISLALRTKYDEANLNGAKPVYQGLVRDDNSKILPNGKVVIDCDLKSAVDAIQREKKVTVSINDYYKAYRAGTLKASESDGTSDATPKDDNHAANIQEIKRAKYRMLGGVCHNE